MDLDGTETRVSAGTPRARGSRNGLSVRASLTPMRKWPGTRASRWTGTGTSRGAGLPRGAAAAVVAAAVRAARQGDGFGSGALLGLLRGVVARGGVGRADGRLQLVGVDGVVGRVGPPRRLKPRRTSRWTLRSAASYAATWLAPPSPGASFSAMSTARDGRRAMPTAVRAVTRRVARVPSPSNSAPAGEAAGGAAGQRRRAARGRRSRSPGAWSRRWWPRRRRTGTRRRRPSR